MAGWCGLKSVSSAASLFAMATSLAPSVAVAEGGPVNAAAPAGADQQSHADDITVTATRSPIKVVNAPVTVTVIDARQIEDTLTDDIKDLVRFEPGVSVRSQPSRFTAALGATGRDGNAGFNIRGLDGNRVLIQTDGIRLPDAFAFGAQATGRGDYADLDLLKSVEILRGPASALYGSDGLAGAVSFVTKDPEDFLRPGQQVGGRARLGYSSADQGWAKGAALAARDGDLSFLLAYTRRDSRELDNKGSNDAPNITRTTPNPQDINSNAVLGKLVWAPDDANRIRLTFDHQDRDVSTIAYSAVATPPLAASSTIGLTAFDTTRRNRVSLDHRYIGSGGLIDRANWAVYWQESKTSEFAAEDRNISADRTRLNLFDNRVYGFNGQVEAVLGSGVIRQRIIVGGDASWTRQTGLRDGTVPPFGETFPSKAFPDTDQTLAGIFVQDEINIGDGRLFLYPALRFDHYSLSAKKDPAYALPVTDQSGQRVSPKFGAIGWITPTLGLFANYAAGFKAPSPSQVNTGFTNIASGYTAIANPNLKPETSQTVEGGLRLREVDLGGAKVTASATGFGGWFRNFIDLTVAGFSSGGLMQFQYQNLGRVEITGAEGKVEARIGGFTASLAASYTHGRATSAGVETPLNSVDPVKIVGGIGYRAPNNRFGGQLIVTHSVRKPASDTNNNCAVTAPSVTNPVVSSACFRPGGFTIADATAFVAVGDFATLRVGVFNLFDQKYAWWSDVGGLSAFSTVTDAYTQPGRNVSASLTLRF